MQFRLSSFAGFRRNDRCDGFGIEQLRGRRRFHAGFPSHGPHSRHCLRFFSMKGLTQSDHRPRLASSAKVPSFRNHRNRRLRIPRFSSFSFSSSPGSSSVGLEALSHCIPAGISGLAGRRWRWWIVATPTIWLSGFWSRCPPCVNAGLLWAYAFFGWMWGKFPEGVRWQDLAYLGLISFCLCLVNIV